MRHYSWTLIVLLLFLMGIYFFGPGTDNGEFSANVSSVRDNSSDRPETIPAPAETISDPTDKNAANNELKIENNLEFSGSTSPTSLLSQVATLQTVGVPVDKDDAVLGDPAAPITLVDFSDFQCPFCLNFFNNVFPEIKKNYIDTGKVKYIFKNLPLPIHAKSVAAALAARCSGEQGMFYEMHDQLFADFDNWTVSDNHYKYFGDYAKSLKLNLKEFYRCYEDQLVRDKIDKDVALAKSLEISATPSFFVNGYLIPGTYPYEVFKQIFDTLLEEEVAR